MAFRLGVPRLTQPEYEQARSVVLCIKGRAGCGGIWVVSTQPPQPGQGEGWARVGPEKGYSTGLWHGCIRASWVRAKQKILHSQVSMLLK